MRRLPSAALAITLVVSLAGADPAVAQSPCRNAAIRSPFGGDALHGVVTVLGSARIDDFNFYKLEWAPVGDPENWSAVSSTKPESVVNALLDQWDTTRIDDGAYRLKLTVVNSVAQEVCRVTVENLSVANRTTPTPEPVATDLPRPTPIARVGTAGAAGATGATGATGSEGGAADAGAADKAAAVATLAPIVPPASAGAADVLDPATWLGVLRADEWVRMFGQSFVLMWIVALAALAINARRRPK